MVTSSKELEEYEENRAFDFFKGFWYGDTQVEQAYPQYSLDFGAFPLPDEVSMMLSHITTRCEQGQDG